MATNHIQVSQHIDESYDAITSGNIKMALFPGLSHVKQANPLEYLTIVDQYISASLFPECSYAHKLALTEILTSIVTSQLVRYRQIMEIASEFEEFSINDAFRAIIEDGKTANSELIGWSWLYYHCVRIDLGITQQKFCELVHLDDRTVRRYQNITLTHITEIVIHKEWRARQSHILATRAILKQEFTQVEMKIILKLYAILEMFRTDEALLCAFASFLEATKNDERVAS